MKPIFKTLLFLTILPSLGPVVGAWGGENSLFTQVPSGDPTFQRLQSLAKAGLLPISAVTPPLTRFEVASLILDVRHKLEAMSGSQGILLAQASPVSPGSDDLLQPPPGELEPIGSAPATESADSLAEAWKNLNSLEEAYQYELKAIRDKAEALKEGIGQAESDQKDLLKSLKGITQNPSVSIHGRGRGQGYDQFFSVPTGAPFSQPTSLTGWGFLDLEPMGTVGKEMRWAAMIRFQSAFLPENTTNNMFVIRRVELDFTPPGFSLRLGDFYEAYTPLTLWSRNDLDLKILPEMMARQDEYRKYESFFQNAPQWPLRGARIGAGIQFPKDLPLESGEASLFAHMIRNGYDATSNVYLGPGSFTDWVFGGKADITSRKVYVTGGPDLVSLDAYGLMMDEFLGTNTPGSPYVPSNPGTWAHRYAIGSLRPKLEAGFGGGLSLGGQFEMSGAYFHDDKMNGARTFNDWAQLGGPYLKLDDSILSFNFLNVGPYYYAPTAQVRQDNLSALSGLPPQFNFDASPESLFPHPLMAAFMTSVARPGSYFGFYDRTQDNVFPYGLATPNRQGWGLDLDVKALEKKALRLSGSFYKVQEISGNLVVNATGTGYDPVDAPPGPPPVRNFTYVNSGASFNMGPLVGLKTDWEWIVDFRMENTQSSLGTLDSFWIVGGMRVGFFPWLEFSVAAEEQRIKGQEAGIQGSVFARYAFLFDNTDLGNYSVFQLDGTVQSLLLSAKFRVSDQSRLTLDYSLSQGDFLPLSGALSGMLVKQFGELAYEVEF